MFVLWLRRAALPESFEVPRAETDHGSADVGSRSGADSRRWTKAELRRLVVVHDTSFSQAQINPALATPELRREFPPVRHALVRRNPANGRESVFVGRHAARIEGEPEAEGRALLRWLTGWVGQRRFRWRVSWGGADHPAVMWDERCLLHRGRPWDRGAAKRLLVRTTVCGDDDDGRTAERVRL